MRIYLLALLIILGCSTARNDIDIHPDYLAGLKFFTRNRSGNVFFLLSKVPNAKPIKHVRFSLNEYFALPIFTNSLLGKTERLLEEILADDLDKIKKTTDFTKDVLIIHNFQSQMESFFLLEFSNNYLPGGYLGRYVPWEGSAEIATMTKAEFESFVKGNAIQTPTPSPKK